MCYDSYNYYCISCALFSLANRQRRKQKPMVCHYPSCYLVQIYKSALEKIQTKEHCTMFAMKLLFGLQNMLFYMNAINRTKHTSRHHQHHGDGNWFIVIYHSFCTLNCASLLQGTVSDVPLGPWTHNVKRIGRVGKRTYLWIHGDIWNMIYSFWWGFLLDCSSKSFIV